MARFYLNTSINAGQNIDLSADIIRHIQVLRMHEHEIIYLFNGNGSEYEAKLLNLDKKSATVQVIKQLELKQQPLLNTISIAIGLINSDKMDLVVQKATELGVKEIIPLYTEYAQRISTERLNKRIEHWQKIIISSCMQCGQNYIPTISPPTLYKDLLAKAPEYNFKVILSPYEVDELDQKQPHRKKLDLDLNTTIPSKTINALLMVGSEGGWSTSEITRAIEYEFIPVKLGNLILRAETAAIAGLSLLNLKLNIW